MYSKTLTAIALATFFASVANAQEGISGDLAN